MPRNGPATPGGIGQALYRVDAENSANRDRDATRSIRDRVARTGRSYEQKVCLVKLELSPESVSLAPLVDEVIGTARQLADQNKNRLKRYKLSWAHLRI
jgi:hypothetical protein